MIYKNITKRKHYIKKKHAHSKMILLKHQLNTPAALFDTLVWQPKTLIKK